MSLTAVEIHSYRPAQDYSAVRACFLALHAQQRSIDPRLPEGEAVADAYLRFMFERAQATAGTTWVARSEGTVVGFVSLALHMPPEEPDDEPLPFAFVSDLAVLPSHRNRGIGRRLLAAAEDYARCHGARRLKIAALAGNEGARRLYRLVGFADYVVEMVKIL